MNPGNISSGGALRAPLLTALFLATSTAHAWATDEIRTERVQFARGTSGTVVEGAITGYQTVDYVLGAAEGQSLRVGMTTDNTATYFNVMAPGETEVAFFNGSTSENRYEGALPKSGDYTIRVYMMRSAARRNERAKYRLEISVTGSGPSPSSARHEATGSGSPDFDATGRIPCSQHKGQPMGQCDFGVARAANEGATVVITRPDGQKRTITFVGGRATAVDAAEGDGAFSAQREGDLNLIRIGDERYEIPDALVGGG